MDALVSTSDGFELAEYDLRLRGEGQVLGDRQHGLPALRLASVRHRRRPDRGGASRRARARRGRPAPGARRSTGRCCARCKRTYRRGVGVGEQRMRIIAGAFRGRTLEAPKGDDDAADHRPGPRGALLVAHVAPGRRPGRRGGARRVRRQRCAGARGAVARVLRGHVRRARPRRASRALQGQPRDAWARRVAATSSTGTSCPLAERGAVPGGPFSLLLLDPPYRLALVRCRAIDLGTCRARAA